MVQLSHATAGWIILGSSVVCVHLLDYVAPPAICGDETCGCLASHVNDVRKCHSDERNENTTEESCLEAAFSKPISKKCFKVSEPSAAEDASPNDPPTTYAERLELTRRTAVALARAAIRKAPAALACRWWAKMLVVAAVLGVLTSLLEPYLDVDDGWWDDDDDAQMAEAMDASAAEYAAPEIRWPPPLVVPEALASRPRGDLPEEFVCPLTFDIMLQPASTPRGTTYDHDALVSWVDRRGRYPAGEAGALRRADLSPNLALRRAIERWVVEEQARLAAEERAAAAAAPAAAPRARASRSPARRRR